MNFGNSAFWRSRLTQYSVGWRPYLLLTALTLLFCLPGIFRLPLTGSAEGENAQIARQAARMGITQQLHFQDRTVSPRPAGIYWLQALSAQLFRSPGSEWPYRLPSVLALLACAIFVFHAGKALFTPERGLLAALLFLCNPAALLSGQTALSAAYSTALITLNIMALALAYRHNSRKPGDLPLIYLLLFWISMGAGMAVCGLLPLLPACGVMLTLWRKDGSFRGFRGLFPFWGILCAVPPALPWLCTLKNAVTAADLPGNAEEWLRLLSGGDLMQWTLPAGNALPALLLLWPGFFFLAQALYLLRRKRTRQGLFCLGWLLPLLVAGLAVPLSAPLLTMPALPGLCLLCAEFILCPERMPQNKVLRGVIWTACLLGALGPLLMLALLLYALQSLFVLPLLWPAPLVLGGMFSVAAILYVRKGARLRLCLICLIFLLLCAPLVTAGILPALRAGWLPLQVADDYARLYQQRSGAEYQPRPDRLICLGLNSPEIIFYTGENTLLLDDPSAAADLVLTNPGDSIAVLAELNQPLLQALEQRRLTAELTDTINGFYAPAGGMATVYIYQSCAPLPSAVTNPSPEQEYPEEWPPYDGFPASGSPRNVMSGAQE